MEDSFKNKEQGAVAGELQESQCGWSLERNGENCELRLQQDQHIVGYRSVSWCPQLSAEWPQHPYYSDGKLTCPSSQAGPRWPLSPPPPSAPFSIMTCCLSNTFQRTQEIKYSQESTITTGSLNWDDALDRESFRVRRERTRPAAPGRGQTEGQIIPVFPSPTHLPLIHLIFLPQSFVLILWVTMSLPKFNLFKLACSQIFGTCVQSVLSPE